MKPITTAFILITACLIVLLGGCSPAPTPVEPTAAPTLQSSATAIPLPSATPTPSPTATLVPTPTLVPTATPTLAPLKAANPKIDAQNAGKLQQVAQWGLGAITSQVSLQNGKLVLATTAEGLYLYDAASLKRIAFFERATQPVFSDDGRLMLFSASSGVGVFDLVSLQALKPLPVSSTFTAAAFSPDNKFAAVAHSSVDIDVVRLEDLSVQTLSRERTAQYEPTITVVTLSKDNQLLLVGESGGGIVLWNLAEKKIAWYLKNLPQNLSYSTFSTDGRYFFSYDANFTYLRESRFGNVVFSALGQASKNAFSPDGKLFYLRNKNVITLYTAGEFPGGVVRTLFVEGAGEVGFSADSSKFNAGGKVLTLADFSLTDSTAPAVKPASITPAQAVQMGHFSNFKGVAAGKQGELWVWGAVGRTVYLWEAGSGKVQTFDIQGGSFIANIAFNPETQRFAACTNAGLEVYSVKEQALKLFGGCAPRGWVAFSPDGSKIARASFARVDLLNAGDGSTLNSLLEHNTDVNKVVFSADGNWLALGTIKNRENGYCQVSLWKLNPVSLIPGFRGKQIPGGGSDTGVYDLAISPDGQWLLGITNMLRQWRVADAEQMKYIEGRAELLLLSPDASLAVTAGSSGSISFYAMPTLESVGTLGSAGQVLGITFSVDGSKLATVNREGVVKLWAVR